MTNFDYLMKEPGFTSFAKPAVTAEKIFNIDPSSSLFNIRKAAEQALKFVIRMEEIDVPEDISFYDALADYEVTQYLDPQLLPLLHYIRKLGNRAVHSDDEADRKKVIAAFQALYEFLNWIAYLYSPPTNNVYDPGRKYDLNILKHASDVDVKTVTVVDDKQVHSLQEEINRLRAQLKAQENLISNRPAYTFNPLEAETRQQYIDVMLENAGWKRGSDWLEEVPVSGMNTATGKGKADYVLFGNDGKPLAVIEAKKTTKDVSYGRQQAKLYADALEKQYGRRPVIFLTNGVETRIIDGTYPERKVSDFYSKRDLEKLFNHRILQEPLLPVHSSDRIAGRYYQKAAINAVCQDLSRLKRKALLVMATGSGKTRTAAALIDWLVKKNWVTNVLFLADRTMLVAQAKKAIVNNLPDLSVTNLTQTKDNLNARVVLSTYQTMLNCIDTAEDDKGRVFTPGHFDLIICDEVHRSIYNKYQDIFNYFDAPIIGLTATPKEEVDRDTYKMFELERGNPTFAYTLEQGVKDGVLVPYRVIETGTKFLEEGIKYDDLDRHEREDYEKRFVDENGVLPYQISANKMNRSLFNEDTIRKVLAFVMENGLKVDYNSKIGKTIIFAGNHRHAEMILKVFHQEYPELGDDFAQVIDNYCYDAEQLKEDFEQRNKMPQIAISVDMLDTGVDVPSILNLVFFRSVQSQTKFWQMIGRGTRLCENLIDGRDKTEFMIFDFCNNFARFGKPTHPSKGSSVLPLQGAIFMMMMGIVFTLQEAQFQTEELQKYRSELIEHMSKQVAELNRKAFNVHQHLKEVIRYSSREGYQKLVSQDVEEAKNELARLIQPVQDDIQAVRFDALMYGIELEQLKKKVSREAFKDLHRKAKTLLEEYIDIPDVKRRKELLKQILEDGWVEHADLQTLEMIRKELRPLMKYIVREAETIYFTDYADVLTEARILPALEESIELEGYKNRAEKYIREHKDNEVIRKLRTNEPLTMLDYQELEKLLWGEVGTKADYEAEFHDKPLGEFVRSITGLDREAANKAFAKYLDEAQLDADQINFVQQIIEYLVQNGTLDKKALQDSPFTDIGGVLLFEHDMDQWLGVMKTINEINERAETPLIQ